MMRTLALGLMAAGMMVAGTATANIVCFNHTITGDRVCRSHIEEHGIVIWMWCSHYPIECGGTAYATY